MDMAARWRILPHDASRVDSLSRELKVSPLVAHLLLSRGFEDPAAAREFLSAKLSGLHDPDRLPGATQAAERITSAVRESRKIVIYGDYDVDGVTGTSLLVRCLKLAGADVGYYVPCRLEEGYGLNLAALETLARTEKASLVVTVDCGIASVEEARACRELGLELIVTDHHEFASELPDAAVLVHPRLPGGDYPFGELSGAGVALKVAWAVCQHLSDSKKVSPHLRNFLVEAVTLAALGTVADVVPLVGENRVLVRHGLEGLNHLNRSGGERAGQVGLRALLEAASLTKNPHLRSSDIGFSLAPRINAAGRLGQARLAVELLTTTSPERAAKLASYLNEQNSLRQTVELRIFKEARKRIEAEGTDAPAFVVVDPGWHAGVIGIVAGRLAERYHRPVFVLAQSSDLAQGSGRSVPGLSLHAALESCREHLVSHGGHAMAAGLKIRPESIAAFREQFCQYVAEHLEPEDSEPVLNIDAEVPLSALTHHAISQLDHLEPFGAGNPKPVFCASGVELAAPPKRIGGGERHLALRIRQNGATLRAVAFGKGERADELGRATTGFDVAFCPSINTFRGYSNVELEVKDWRIDEGAKE